MVLIADPNANAVTAGVNAIETASAAGETSLGVSPAAEAVVANSTTHSLPARRRSVSELSPARLEPLAKRQRRKENEQISTGVPICSSRTPFGPALLKHRKRVKGRKADLLSSLPTGKFAVALDVADNGRKCFTYFQSPEDYFRETTSIVNRNFYEIVWHNHPCCLYFDLEHFTESALSDSKLEATVRLLAKEIRSEWPHLQHEAIQDVVITTGSRPAKGKFKHSFHLVYPRIGFECNYGEMRKFAQRVAPLATLQALNDKGGAMSLLDVNVYSRDQNFRLTESWKYTTSKVTAELALRLHPPRLHTLVDLLRTVITRTCEVETWVKEPRNLPEKVTQTIQLLLHAHCLDALTVTADDQVIGHGLNRCVCSGQKVVECHTIYNIKHKEGDWTLQCEHAGCEAAQRSKLPLGKVRAERVTRLWHPAPNWAGLPVVCAEEKMQLLATQMNQLGTAAAIVKNWAYRVDQPARVNSTYLMLPAETNTFLTALVSGQQPDMVHLNKFAHVRALIFDTSNNAWCAAHYDKEQMILRLEASMGGASRQMTRLLSAWKSQDLDQEWTVVKSSLETGSDPGNASLLTWATLLPSYHDDRITGEFIVIIKHAAHTCLQGDLTNLRWLTQFGCQQLTSQMLWQLQRTYQTKDKTARPKVQSKLDLFPEAKHPTAALPELEPVEIYSPIMPDILCASEPLGNSAWAKTTPHDPKSTRIISQNVGPVGLMGSLDAINFIVQQNKPALLLLQDCRIGAEQKESDSAQLRKAFPQYQIFIRCGTRVQKVAGSKKRYRYAAVTMLHKSCGQGTELFGDKQDADQRRLLTIRVTSQSSLCSKTKDFCVTNVYNYTAKEALLQDRVLRELRRRMTHPDANSLLHLLGGDFNASLLPESRLGATDRNLERADKLFGAFIRDRTLCRRWWAGRVREGIWTRRHPSAAQAARIDEILVLDPQELEDDPAD